MKAAVLAGFLMAIPGALAQQPQAGRDPAIGVLILVFLILFYFWYSRRK